MKAGQTCIPEAFIKYWLHFPITPSQTAAYVAVMCLARYEDKLFKAPSAMYCFLKRSWGRSTSPNLIMQSKACSRYHIAKVATARWIPHTPSQLCAYWNSFGVDLSCVLTWSCNLFFRVLTYFCFVLLSLATSYAQKDINFNKWYICGVGFWSIEKQLAILCFSNRVT